jgi:hypothetical protein
MPLTGHRAVTGRENGHRATHSAQISVRGSAATLRPVIAAIKSDLVDGVRQGACADLAFVGNSSDVYAWTPCFMADLDVFLFADALDERLGRWLLDRAAWWRAQLGQQCFDFELRIIEGPYKPAIARLERPVIVLHLGVFTELSYVAQSPLKRWAWRKYACLTEPGRLARLAPPRPDLTELLSGPKGVEYRLHAIASGSVTMNELALPSFREMTFSVSLDEPNFVECCFAYALSCARGHGRLLAFEEADSLPNETYFQWYSENVLSSGDLLQLLQIKTRCRNTGFDVDKSMVQTLAVNYLRSLSAILATNSASKPPR